MTDQPTTGRPLTEGDVALLKRGDIYLCKTWGPVQFDRFDDSARRAFVLDMKNNQVRLMVPLGNTFIGRPDAAGWIAWSGGDNPVPGVRVEIRWSNGTPDERNTESDSWVWDHYPDALNIIAFRLPTAEADRRAEGVSEAWYKCEDCNGDGYVYPNGIGDGHNEQAVCGWCGGSGHLDNTQTLSTRPADADKGVDAGLIERLRSNKALPVCPYDRRSPDYWTAPNDEPCKVCGSRNEDGAPDLCTGADTRVMDEAAAALEAAAVREKELRDEIQHLYRDDLKLVALSKADDEIEALKARAADLEALFNALRDNSWDLRCFDMPTGGDDCDIGWRVVGHWQAEPRERTIAEAFRDDPAEAVRQALAATQQRNAGKGVGDA